MRIMPATFKEHMDVKKFLHWLVKLAIQAWRNVIFDDDKYQH